MARSYILACLRSYNSVPIWKCYATNYFFSKLGSGQLELWYFFVKSCDQGDAPSLPWLRFADTSWLPSQIQGKKGQILNEWTLSPGVLLESLWESNWAQWAEITKNFYYKKFFCPLKVTKNFIFVHWKLSIFLKSQFYFCNLEVIKFFLCLKIGKNWKFSMLGIWNF